jgi:hypothetical protein
MDPIPLDKARALISAVFRRARELELKPMAVCVLANADVSTVALSNLAKVILHDAESTVGVETADGPSLERDLRLAISPNPIARRGTITIDFTITAAARVRLRVYDVRGALVRGLRDAPTAIGTHRVDWTPAHEGVGPGVYFVRLSSDGGDATRKVVVLQ